MNKSIFLAELAMKLKALPKSEINKSLDYYSEIIDDRMEEGMSEEDAVLGLGNIQDIAQEALLDATPLFKLIIPPASLSKSNIGLWVLALPLLIILFSLLFIFYACAWLVIIALFLVELSFLLAGIAGVITSIIDFNSNIPFSLLLFFGGLICIGIGIFTFSPIKLTSKKIIGLTEWGIRKIKLLFQKEVVSI